MHKIYALLLVLVTFTTFAEDEQEQTDLVSLSINDIELAVEYADEQHERALGLMYRRELCENCGMLFKFDRIKIASMWMRNTLIPLDVAYINAFGRITDIKQMEPEDETSISSSVPVRFALEMNQGWFEKNNIKVGDDVMLPNYVR
ncbi:DUF192 domain-containing protein [Glaciecola sp. 1036]|uniref:DUF192 domain-containing protein n=1 Tax=Alteromonadaceae TaxID=72275 RepID=UPI003D01CB63